MSTINYILMLSYETPSIVIQKEDVILEKLPQRGPIKIKLPTPDYESTIWSV